MSQMEICVRNPSVSVYRSLLKKENLADTSRAFRVSKSGTKLSVMRDLDIKDKKEEEEEGFKRQGLLLEETETSAENIYSF